VGIGIEGFNAIGGSQAAGDMRIDADPLEKGVWRVAGGPGEAVGEGKCPAEEAGC